MNKGQVKSKLRAVIFRWQADHDERLPLRTLEDETGLSRDFLSRLQQGKVKHLDLDKLQVLCDFFGVTPNDLLWSQ